MNEKRFWRFVDTLLELADKRPNDNSVCLLEIYMTILDKYYEKQDRHTYVYWEDEGIEGEIVDFFDIINVQRILTYLLHWQKVLEELKLVRVERNTMIFSPGNGEPVSLVTCSHYFTSQELKELEQKKLPDNITWIYTGTGRLEVLVGADIFIDALCELRKYKV